MKPRIIDRLLLGLVLLLFIAAMVLVILFLTGVLPVGNFTGAVEELMGSSLKAGYIRIGIIAAAAILGVIAIKLLFTPYKAREKEPANNASLLSADENGTAYISAASIDSMAQKYIRSNSRIRECTNKVTVNPDSSVELSLKAIVLADTNIPELCATVRKELKEYIESYAGVKVEKIAFTVVNTYSPATATRVN